MNHGWQLAPIKTESDPPPDSQHYVHHNQQMQPMDPPELPSVPAILKQEKPSTPCGRVHYTPSGGSSSTDSASSAAFSSVFTPQTQYDNSANTSVNSFDNCHTNPHPSSFTNTETPTPKPKLAKSNGALKAVHGMLNMSAKARSVKFAGRDFSGPSAPTRQSILPNNPRLKLPPPVRQVPGEYGGIWQQHIIHTSNLHVLKAIKASSEEVYAAMTDLFHWGTISNLRPNGLRHLVFNVDPAIIKNTVIRRRFARIEQCQTRGFHSLKYTHKWDMNDMWASWTWTFDHACLKPHVAVRNVWKFYAVMFMVRRIRDASQEFHMVKVMDPTTWQHFYNTLYILSLSEDASASFFHTEALYNVALLYDDDITAQFLNSDPNPRLSMVPSQLSWFIQRVTLLDQEQVENYVNQFFEFLNDGKMFTTFYCDKYNRVDKSQSWRPSLV